MSYPIASSLLDGIVLAVVERESTYGYRITQDVQKVLEISDPRCIRCCAAYRKTVA